MSLFDLATGRIRIPRQMKGFWPHDSLSRIQERVLDELLEGPKSTSYLTVRYGISQIGLEKMEDAGYIRANRTHKEYRGLGSEIWTLGERGLDYLGQRIAVLD